ncbi:MAG: diguanylate cyclase [Nocardioides sp.]|nr:diguanylate cyclase [Nocardioides sp.]
MSDQPDDRLTAAGPAAVPPDLPASGTGVALGCARALLRVRTRAEAAQVLHRAIRDLGGEVRPAAGSAQGPLPGVDVSLGVDDPSVAVEADGSARTSARLRGWLAILVEDAEAAATRCDAQQSQEVRARTDAVTGLPDRREGDERLAAARPGDVVCLLDLDDFKGLNDSRGHAAGDRALRRFGEILAEHVRGLDFVGRYGGDEFLVLLTVAPVHVAMRRMWEISTAWAAEDPVHAVSVGVALVDERGPEAAAAAADRALYRSKRAGGGRASLAGPDDRTPIG